MMRLFTSSPWATIYAMWLVPHISSISSKIPFNCSSSLICSPMNCAICDDHTLRSFRKACTEWTHNLHIAIVSLASVILAVHSLPVLSVFSLLHGTLLDSLSLTRRVSILGRDDKSPRKSGVASTVRSGAGSTVFNVDAIGWNGGICITAPVERTTIRLAADDAHDDSHSPGAFPFVPATFVSFLLPIRPNDLSHFVLAFVHSLHIRPGSLMHGCLFFSHSPHLVMCALGPDSSCTGGPPTTLTMTTMLLAMNR